MVNCGNIDEYYNIDHNSKLDNPAIEGAGAKGLMRMYYAKMETAWLCFYCETEKLTECVNATEIIKI